MAKTRGKREFVEFDYDHYADSVEEHFLDEQEYEKMLKIDPTEAKFSHQEDQIAGYFDKAAEEDKVPWQKEFKAEEMPVPHNPISGKPLTGNNLVAAVLHMQHIGSKDPRYIAENQITKLKVREGAESLYVCYREDVDGKTKIRTAKYYNARDIEGAPEYKPELAPSATTVKAKDGKEIEDTLGNNLSGFITALRTGQNFTPAQSKFSNEEQLKHIQELALTTRAFPNTMGNPTLMAMYKGDSPKMLEKANIDASVAIKQFEAPAIKAPERKQPAIEQGGISM